jgi:hypothetical protein
MPSTVIFAVVQVGETATPGRRALVVDRRRGFSG